MGACPYDHRDFVDGAFPAYFPSVVRCRSFEHAENSNELSGSAGLLTAICFFVGGLTGLLTRNSAKKGGPIASCVFYWFAFFLSRMFSGSFSDLRIWGVLAFLFGTVYLIAAMKTRKETIIAGVIAAIYFVIGIA
jgi:hypothetical protein